MHSTHDSFVLIGFTGAHPLVCCQMSLGKPMARPYTPISPVRRASYMDMRPLPPPPAESGSPVLSSWSGASSRVDGPTYQEVSVASCAIAYLRLSR